MPCDKLEWKTGPVPESARYIIVLNSYGEYEVSENKGRPRVSFEPVGDGLYRQVVEYEAYWDIWDMEAVVKWAELPDPDTLKE